MNVVSIKGINLSVMFVPKKVGRDGEEKKSCTLFPLERGKDAKRTGNVVYISFNTFYLLKNMLNNIINQVIRHHSPNHFSLIHSKYPEFTMLGVH